MLLLLPLGSWAQGKKEVTLGYMDRYDSLPKLSFEKITAQQYEKYAEQKYLSHPKIKESKSHWFVPTQLGPIQLQKYQANRKTSFKGVQYLGYLPQLHMYVAESTHTAEHIGFSDLFLIDRRNAYQYALVSIGDDAVEIPIPSPKGNYIVYYYNEVYAKNSSFIGLLEVNPDKPPATRLSEKMSSQTKDWAVENIKWITENSFMVKAYTLNSNRIKDYHYYLSKIGEQSPNQQSKGPFFGQTHTGCDWTYYSPFADRSYVLALQSCTTSQSQEKSHTLYFGQTQNQQEHLFWKEPISIQYNAEVKTTDFNGDGHQDLLIFSGTGARGSNEYYHLYIADPKNKKLTKIKGFENISNPSYNAKHRVIVGYGYADKNYYSLYRISKTHNIIPIGKAFEDNFESNAQLLDQKIKQHLNLRP